VRAAELGAGELLVTSVDREGTGRGFDLELIREISGAVPIPVIAAGGAGRVDHVIAAIREGHADAVALGTLLHYRAVRAPEINASAAKEEGNTEFLNSRRDFGVIDHTSIADVKRALAEHGIACRPSEMAEVA
jgi:cyclase